MSKQKLEIEKAKKWRRPIERLATIPAPEGNYLLPLDIAHHLKLRYFRI